MSPAKAHAAARARTVAARTAVAVAAALAVYLLTCLLQAPGPLPAGGFGLDWARMSLQPLALVGEFPQRLLCPLLAHLCGLDGAAYPWFSRLLSVLLLATVFEHARSAGRAAADALLVTLAIGLSGAVAIYKGLVGFSDSMTVILLLLSLRLQRHGAAFWLLLLLNLLNHELAALFVPWLWFVRRQAGGDWRFDLGALAVVLLAYAGFRQYVAAHAQAQAFTAGFFLANHYLPWGTLWLCLLALVHWAATFGPLLAVLGWHQAAPRPQRERWHLWLVLLGLGGIFAVAYDVLRHANILALPLTIAAVRLLEDRRRRLPFALLLLATVPWTAWLALPIDGKGARVYGQITDWMLQCQVLSEQPPGVLHIDHDRILGCVLPAVWGRWLGCIAAVAAFVGAGAWLQRRQARSTAAPMLPGSG